MPKGFASKYGVSLITMNAFLRSVGLAAGRGKIHHRIDRAFKTHGRPRPSGVSVQNFCLQNLEFIREKAAGFKTAKIDKSVIGDEFLQSYAWRSLRMQALKKYGPKCMCCGATPQTGAVMNVDHIKPRRFFPQLALNIDNLQILCHDCNHGKGNWDQTDWRPQDEHVDSEVVAMLREIAKGG